MPWGEMKLEDFKKAGLDPEVLSKTAEAVAGLDDKIKNAVTEATKNMASSASIDEMKTQLTNLAAKLQGTTKSEPPTPNVEESPDWILDPEGATKKEINKSIGGIAVTMATMRAENNYNNFKASGARAFSKYEKDIKEMWDKQPLTNRQDPELIKNIYKIIIADHVDEIAKQGETFFVEPQTSGNGHSNTEIKKKPEDVLSKDELELAKKWGISPEDYLKEKELPNSTAVTTYA